jgi:hypothetical protein
MPDLFGFLRGCSDLDIAELLERKLLEGYSVGTVLWSSLGQVEATRHE